MEEGQRICGDTNCHSKSITVPVTVVLELAASLYGSRDAYGNPRQMSFSHNQNANLRLRYMHFSKSGRRAAQINAAQSAAALDSTMRAITLRDGAREYRIRSYYQTLFQAWGAQHWWPAKSRFEVIVGAYLTQNTAWTNVEKALTNLRSARLLSVEGIRRTSPREIERLIRPAGYFRQKAKRLKLFVAFLDRRYGGSLARMFAAPTAKLREELLNLHGIGPETADSILLYAGNHPVFVVDAYTRRILARHRVLPEKASYEEIRKLFERALFPLAQPVADSEETRTQYLAAGLTGTAHAPSAMSTAKRTALTQVYNEMHGLIVGVGKHFCKKSQARCDDCPLQRFLPQAK
jgi:endonuclease III related protein